MARLPEVGNALNRHWRRVVVPLYLVAVVCIGMAVYLSSSHHPNRSDVFFVVGLVCTLTAFLIVLITRKVTPSLAGELFVCYLPFALVWILSIFSPLAQRQSILFGETQFMVWLGLAVFVVPTIILLFLLIKSLVIEKVLGVLRAHWALVAILVVFIALSIEVLPQWAVIDSWEYLHYLQSALNWNFTLENINAFRLCGHQSFSVTLWYMIGGYLSPGNPLGPRIINIVLMSSAIICFYAVLLKLGSEDRGKYTLNAVLTCLFAFNPLILGNIFEINLDFLETVFLVWLICAFFYHRSTLFVFSALLLAFSKETGFVLLCGFCLGWLLAVILKDGSTALRSRLRAHIQGRYIMVAGAAISISCSILLYLLAPQWMASQSEALPQIHLFEFNSLNIATTLKELYLLNFAWIFVAIILLAGCCGLYSFLAKRYRKKRLLKNAKARKTLKKHLRQDAVNDRSRTLEVLPLVGLYLAYLLFSLSYLTYHFPRYIDPHIPCFTLLTIVSLKYLFRRRRALLTAGTSLLAGLLLVQNFNTVDPVTLSVFKKIDIGGSNIVTTRVFFMRYEERLTDPWLVSSRELTHAASYNRQYSYFGTAFERLLSEIDYDDETLLLVDPVYDEFGTYAQLFGKKLITEDVYYYDPGSKQVYQESGPNALNLIVVPGATIDLTQYSSYDRVFFISVPYREGFEQNVSIKGLPILSQGISEYRFWEIEYYQIK